MKKIICFLLFLISLNCLFSEDFKKTFIKGNIADKTTAVRQSTGSDNIWLSKKAIDFIIENKDILQNDREIDGLALAAILSIQNDYVSSLAQAKKDDIMNDFVNLFRFFYNSSTVQIAIQSKVLALKDLMDTSKFTNELNEYLQINSNIKDDTGLMRSIIMTLGAIGDNVSFTILYNYLNDRRYAGFNSELEQSVINLIPVSFDEVLRIIHSKDVTQLNKIFALTQKNSNISQNFICDIAENVLNETIILIGNSSEKNQVLVNLQIESLQILAQHKWTRAAYEVISFFDSAKKEFNNGIMNENQMVQVINCLPLIAPIDTTNPLIKYLEELNQQTEANQTVGEKIVLSVINTLGAIGDKSAFDCLLSVTYLSYPEQVLSAARDALAGLRW